MIPRVPAYVTATAQVVAVGRSGILSSLVLTAGADTATAVVRDGDGSGSIILAVSAVANTTVPVVGLDAIFRSGVHITLTGTSPRCTVCTD